MIQQIRGICKYLGCRFRTPKWSARAKVTKEWNNWCRSSFSLRSLEICHSRVFTYEVEEKDGGRIVKEWPEESMCVAYVNLSWVSLDMALEHSEIRYTKERLICPTRDAKIRTALNILDTGFRICHLHIEINNLREQWEDLWIEDPVFQIIHKDLGYEGEQEDSSVVCGERRKFHF